MNFVNQTKADHVPENSKQRCRVSTDSSESVDQKPSRLEIFNAAVGGVGGAVACSLLEIFFFGVLHSTVIVLGGIFGIAVMNGLSCLFKRNSNNLTT